MHLNRLRMKTGFKDMGSIAKLKRTVIADLLEQEDFILLLINTQTAAVRLPPHLLEAKQPVGIHIGLRMAIPVPDLKIDDEGISGTLSFQRQPFFCFFPWESIIQTSVEDEHLIWLIPQSPENQPASVEPETERPKRPSRPQLKLV